MKTWDTPNRVSGVCDVFRTWKYVGLLVLTASDKGRRDQSRPRPIIDEDELKIASPLSSDLYNRNLICTSPYLYNRKGRKLRLTTRCCKKLSSRLLPHKNKNTLASVLVQLIFKESTMVLNLIKIQHMAVDRVPVPEEQTF